MSWSLQDHWIAAWGASKVPVYFVIVLAPGDFEDWLVHQDVGTMHQTAAFWKRLDTEELGTSITVAKEQRFTSETIAEWHQDLQTAFAPVAAT